MELFPDVRSPIDIYAQSLIAPSIASAPELVKKRVIGEADLRKARGETLRLRNFEKVGGVPKLAALLNQRFDEMGMRIAERGHGDAAAEIEKSFACRRSQPDSHFPAQRRDRRGA